MIRMLICQVGVYNGIILWCRLRMDAIYKMSGADKAVFDSMKESQQPEAESFFSKPLLTFLHFHRIFLHICRCVAIDLLYT
jgi:hypothetical protein